MGFMKSLFGNKGVQQEIPEYRIVITDVGPNPVQIISIIQKYLQSDYTELSNLINSNILQIKAMKQVAAKVKLELAQYNELLTFAQFGSDLDKATKAQLERGHRIMEVLKQSQYKPYAVEEQVVSFFALINGYLDSIELDKVRRFEAELITELKNTTNILDEIREKKALDKDIEAKLGDAINAFKKNFN